MGNSNCSALYETALSAFPLIDQFWVEFVCDYLRENHALLQAIEALLFTSEGDMRKAITTLQSSGRLKGEDTITKADIYEIAGVSVPLKLVLVKTFI